MPDYTGILFEVRDGVGTITLNRPDSANALDHQTSMELVDALIRCEENREVRAVILTGSGRFFCGGADLKSFYTRPDGLKNGVSFIHVAASRIVRAPFPVIGAINGTAAGGGMGLACACDLLIAAESAKFIMAFTRRGLSPDSTTTYFLPRRIGIGRALELTYLNRTLTAREALEWGLANRVVADASLVNEAYGVAAELARGPTRAYAAAKQLMHTGLVESLETQIENEIRTIAKMIASEETKEAVRAFNEKRTPVFRGR
jgi:2-(1,2-epoxy-1,2-dihydrophenyl)acetyl-CoA isomerase